MPSYIVKPSPDEEFYFEWSTIVDCPTYWGTRQDLEQSGFVTADADRFERADRTGTSSFDGFEGWEQDEFWVREIGPEPFTVKRSNMRAFCESLDPHDTSKFDASLTIPWIDGSPE